MNTRSALLLVFLATVLFAIGCSDSNPLAPFEPEVVTDADAFQFQITDASDVSVTRSYTWTNTSTRVTIDHSTTLTDGAATVVVLDADGTEVYRNALIASGTGQSEPGSAGAWTVRVVFANFDGTANFRVEKM